MEVEITESAEEDLAYWQEHSPKTVQKINDLIDSCRKDPFRGIGKPEPLRHDLSGFWSRRITLDDRMVYCVEKSKIIIIALRYHYSE